MSRGKKALVTGVTGQDGSYLAEFLLAKGYEVHGLVRRSSTFNTRRIDHLYVDPHEAGASFFLHYGDLTDSGQLSHLIYNLQPDEVYHLAAQSHVRVSFDMPEYTGEVTGLGVTRLLEAIRRSGINILLGGCLQRRCWIGGKRKRAGKRQRPRGRESALGCAGAELGRAVDIQQRGRASRPDADIAACNHERGAADREF